MVTPNKWCHFYWRKRSSLWWANITAYVIKLYCPGDSVSHSYCMISCLLQSKAWGDHLPKKWAWIILLLLWKISIFKVLANSHKHAKPPWEFVRCFDPDNLTLRFFLLWYPCYLTIFSGCIIIIFGIYIFLDDLFLDQFIPVEWIYMYTFF